MSFIYNMELTEEKDQVRLLIQDTNASRQLFQDEEILWVISTEANIYMAAARLCDILITQSKGVKFKKISEFSIAFDSKFYMSLGAQLRARGMTHQVPYAGGISKGDKLAQQQDTDWVSPSIPRGIDDNQDAPKPATPPVNPLATI